MRNIIFVSLFLISSLIILWFFVGVSSVNPKPLFTQQPPHLYGDEKKSLEKIHITIFYFIPKDIATKKYDTWKEVTEENIKKVIEFHNLQFNNLSKIDYEFFSSPIIGEKTVKEYEQLFTYDDHDALVPVKEEIERRALVSTGDLYVQQEIKSDTTVRNVYLVIFEGKGAAGNDDFCLISRSYLTDPLYKENGATFLAHEFYHTLGLLDNYQTSNYVYKDTQQTTISILTQKDIMGQVNIPLSYTYINPDTLKKMGL